MSSKELKAISVCAYLTDVEVKWRPEDYRCLNFVKILKGEPFKGFVDVKIKGSTRRISSSNSGELVPLIHMKMADILSEHEGNDLVMVPIPNSSCTHADDSTFNTLRIAKGMARKLTNAKVSPCITFKTKQTPSHQGGPRDPYHFEQEYRISDPPIGSRIVLVDDVITTGSHFIAAYWRLKDMGCDIAAAMAFGRRVTIQEDTPFSAKVDYLNVERNSVFDFDFDFDFDF